MTLIGDNWPRIFCICLLCICLLVVAGLGGHFGFGSIHISIQIHQHSSSSSSSSPSSPSPSSSHASSTPSPPRPPPSPPRKNFKSPAIRDFIWSALNNNIDTMNQTLPPVDHEADLAYLNPISGDAERTMAEKCGALGFEEGGDVDPCPDESLFVYSWLQELRNADDKPKGRQWTIVNAGANKGYLVAQMIQVLGVSDINPRLTRSYGAVVRAATKAALRKAFLEDEIAQQPLRQTLLGACCDGVPEMQLQHFRPHLHRNMSRGDLTVYLFDTVPSHVAHLQQFFINHVGLLPKRTRVIQAAVGARAGGTVMFPKTAFGIEHMSAVQSDAMGTGEKEPVRTTTLDEVVTEDYIDMLFVDVEGMDLFVAAGSQNHLLRGKVGFAIFELGIFRPPRPTFKSFVFALESAGYLVFFPMVLREGAHKTNKAKIRRRFALVSGECWRPEYERMGRTAPGNVLAINARREPELVAAVARLSKAGRETTSDRHRCFGGSTQAHHVSEQLGASQDSELAFILRSWMHLEI